MNAYIFVYAILAILIAAMVYVVGMPWLTPRPHRNSSISSPEDIGRIHS